MVPPIIQSREMGSPDMGQTLPHFTEEESEAQVSCPEFGARCEAFCLHSWGSVHALLCLLSMQGALVKEVIPKPSLPFSVKIYH